ncbi:MAG: hypothetical protein M0Z71_15390 [Nitrospiraceae bacterium]|nr:hypothetical protein [Nitrospiraceae bacterium]
MKFLTILSAFCLLIGMLTVSCTRQTAQSLVGTWQEVNGTESIEFLKDGSFRGKMIWDMTKQPVEVMGTYSRKGDLVDLKVDKPAQLTPMIWKVTISGTEMTIAFQQGGALKLDGSSLRYRRIS